MTSTNVSFYGFRCDLCPAYIKNVDILVDKKTIREGWKKYFDLDVTEEHIRCVGCTNEGYHLDTECPVRSCAVHKQMENCSFCSFYQTCEHLPLRADLIESIKQKMHTPISRKEYALFFRPYEGRKELEKTRKRRRSHGV